MDDSEVTEVGRYRIHGAFASGGMATVHLGRLRESAGFSRTVAIKRLHQQFAADPYFVSMLREEARIAGSIRHPNAIPIVDVVSTRDEFFLVMDYVPGESLARLLQRVTERGERIPISVAVAILVGVLHGLHAAHQAVGDDGAPLGIVHRDVSPQNVLVGTDGLARVIDFGIAKARGSRLTTQKGELKGKLRYMAPEQFEGEPISAATDVYAASIVLWEAIAARRLFDAETESAVLLAALRRTIAPLATVIDHDSLDASALAALRRLDEVVARGTERDPRTRFASAREMALALDRCVTPATPGEVEAWMTALVGDLLRARALLVEAAERGTGPTQAPLAARPGDRSTVLGAKAAPARSRRPTSLRSVAPLVGGLGLMAALAIGVGFFASARRAQSQASSAAVPPAQSAVITSAALVVPPDPSAAAAAAAAAAAPPPEVAAVGPLAPVAASAAPLGATASPARSLARGPAKTRATSHPRASCSPPFSWDPSGTKHYKLECL